MTLRKPFDFASSCVLCGRVYRNPGDITVRQRQFSIADSCVSVTLQGKEMEVDAGIFWEPGDSVTHTDHPERRLLQ